MNDKIGQYMQCRGIVRAAMGQRCSISLKRSTSRTASGLHPLWPVESKGLCAANIVGRHSRRLRRRKGAERDTPQIDGAVHNGLLSAHTPLHVVCPQQAILRTRGPRMTLALALPYRSAVPKQRPRICLGSRTKGWCLEHMKLKGHAAERRRYGVAGS